MSFVLLLVGIITVWCVFFFGIMAFLDWRGSRELNDGKVAILASDWDRQHPWTERWNGHQITKLRERVRTGAIQAWEYSFELDELLAEEPEIRSDTGVPTYTRSRENPFKRPRPRSLTPITAQKAMKYADRLALNEGEKARMVAEFARKYSRTANEALMLSGGVTLSQPIAALPDSEKVITAYDLDGTAIQIQVRHLAAMRESTPGAMIFHYIDGTSDKLWLKPPDQLMRHESATEDLLRLRKQLAKGGLVGPVNE